jgi:hypothetical protein
MTSDVEASSLLEDTSELLHRLRRSQTTRRKELLKDGAFLQEFIKVIQAIAQNMVIET